MDKPESRHFDPIRKTSFLHMPNGEIRESYIRGGISFPYRYKTASGINNHGYIVLSGQDIKTSKVYIYEQMNWVTIDDILDDKNKIKYNGLSHWLNKMWNEYYGRTFCFHQPEELSSRFRLQIKRSPMIQPKPRIIDMEVVDKNDLVSIIWHWVKTEKIEIEKESMVALNLQEMMKDSVAEMTPAIHALGCCLLGIERYPWRKPYQENIREILIPA